MILQECFSGVTFRQLVLITINMLVKMICSPYHSPQNSLRHPHVSSKGDGTEHVPLSPPECLNYVHNKWGNVFTIDTGLLAERSGFIIVGGGGGQQFF